MSIPYSHLVSVGLAGIFMAQGVAAQTATPATTSSAVPTCASAVQDKKLFGAAKTSFLTKCERDATARCELAATERKLFGAAKNSNVKKCVKDSVG